MVRNLLQYPVTYEEKIALLTEFIDFRANMRLVGDMKLVIMKRIRDDLVELALAEKDQQDAQDLESRLD